MLFKRARATTVVRARIAFTAARLQRTRHQAKLVLDRLSLSLSTVGAPYALWREHGKCPGRVYGTSPVSTSQVGTRHEPAAWRESASGTGFDIVGGGFSRFLAGAVGLSMVLFAVTTQPAQAEPGEGGGCTKMHDWKFREHFLADWQQFHSTTRDIISDPSEGTWSHVADRGFRSAPHSEMLDAYVDNIHHPTCGGEV